MVNPKMTYILIAITFVSMFATIFGIVINKYSTSYGLIQQNNTLEFYDKAEQLHNTSEQVKEQVTRITQPTGVLDFIGGIFSSAYQVLKTVPNSFSLLFELIDQMIVDSNLGEGITIIRDAIFTIFTFLIFLGIILRIVLNQGEVI